MTIRLDQMMYTPNDNLRTNLIADDRPYAGALMFSMGYNARKGNQLRTSQVRIGVVDPVAYAKQAHRTRELRGQREVPVYGTVTIGRRF